ncbi:DUF4097 family beta strand repeat protein, partial [candidate division KSB1 bacterium]|nr:DUF4097 family beta strand repeat protein [candidate division KSB1 bacterium]
MKKINPILVLALLPALASLVIGQEISGSSGKFRITVTKSYQVTQGGNLDIRGVNGDITVASWSKAKVEINEELTLRVYTRNEAEEVLKRIERAYSQQGNTISVEGESLDHTRERAFSIFVPEKFNLDLSTVGGDLEIQDIQGNLEARTAGGDVALKNITGVTQIKTSGGDLDFSHISGQLRAHTSGGDVMLGEMLGECDIKTSGGDIEVTHATSRITLHTSGGCITMTEMEGPVQAHTSGGDVELYTFSGDRAALSTH